MSPSITACLRCREQKLKCGREHPICTRCERLQATCSYPLPPNRRGPRTQRRVRLSNRTDGPTRDLARFRRSTIRDSIDTHPVSTEIHVVEDGRFDHIAHNGSSSPVGPGATFDRSIRPPPGPDADHASEVLTAGTPVLSHSYSTQLRTMGSATTETSRILDQPALPPIALGLSLLEIYFTRVYNAPLMFHKPTLFQQYLNGSLNDALTRTLFALATLFLPNSTSNEQETEIGNTELNVLGIYRTSGLPWAKAALKEATVLAMESPSLMVVQALQCLQYYWFCTGQPTQGNLCIALAYRASEILGYSKKMSENSNDCEASTLESELGRRCFWACWISTCIVMEPEPYVRASWEEAAMVPLPAMISDTLSPDITLSGEAMDAKWNSVNVTPETRTKTCGPAALLIKMVGVWSKVQLLCKDFPRSPNEQSLESGDKLSRLVTSLFKDAISARDSDSERMGHRHSEDDSLILVHDALYHQCQISIHSMSVPVFSSISENSKIDLEKQRISAKLVTKHADLFQNLLEPYISGQRHISFLPPLVGYGAFVVGVVFLAMEVSCPEKHRNAVSMDRGGNGCRLIAIESILSLLDRLRVYWKALQRPWEMLYTAFQTDFSKYNRRLEAAGPRSDALQTHSIDCASVEANAGRAGDQTYIAPNKQSPTVLSNRPTAIGIQAQHDSPLAGLTVSELNEQGQISSNDLLMGQFNERLGHDDDWYSLSFAESGIEQFSGLEPSALFQQVWQTFS